MAVNRNELGIGRKPPVIEEIPGRADCYRRVLEEVRFAILIGDKNRERAALKLGREMGFTPVVLKIIARDQLTILEKEERKARSKSSRFPKDY